MWQFSYPLFMLGGVKTGLAVLNYLSSAPFSPHSTVSAFPCYFPILNSHKCVCVFSGFLFMLTFPSWDRNRPFPSFLQDPLGRFEDMAASQCFLMAGCGRFLCLARAQQLLRQTYSTPGHPRSALPTRTHSRRRIRVLAGQKTGVQGSVGDGGKLGALCQWGSYVPSRDQRAVQLSTANYTDWAGRCTAENTQNSITAAIFIQHRFTQTVNPGTILWLKKTAVEE